MHAWLRVAEIIKAKSQDGGLVAASCDGLPFLLAEGIEVAFVPPQTDMPRSGRVLRTEQAEKGSHRVFFDTVPDFATAMRLVGCFCLVRRDALPESLEPVREVDFRGFEVHDEDLGLLGKICEVIDNPWQKLLSVEWQGKPLLIPFVDEFVKGIDEAKSCIRVKIPPSLLDLAADSKRATDAH